MMYSWLSYEPLRCQTHQNETSCLESRHSEAAFCYKLNAWECQEHQNVGPTEPSRGANPQAAPGRAHHGKQSSVDERHVQRKWYASQPSDLQNCSRMVD